ncbi:C-type lectin domain family 4 member F-like [Clupea harengus]|uniref:C-type lectin domain family 4 member F-like n=1 Tax=Clupea harengus TaxID=7950 RepID=A0A6P8GMQ1_CLUHA|nr:C-type lectin domain family 4 member F-like [Clupea harengus]
MGGHLVIITSQQEMDFLKAKGEDHWIGLTDAQEEGKWRWVDNTPLTDPNFWGPRQPDNYKGYDPDGENCVMITRGEWNDRSCGVSFKRICEKKI